MEEGVLVVIGMAFQASITGTLIGIGFLKPSAVQQFATMVILLLVAGLMLYS